MREIILSEDDLHEAIGLWLLKRRGDVAAKAEAYNVTFITHVPLKGSPVTSAKVEIEEACARRG